ncbi:MAG: DUF2470 domain-containing protein [Mycetocola reblochoni]|nr:DUF2470 domain-containing protein [Mycetocola reblochoni]RLP67800.1 DUF2470 domain-containing protein [Mycetocola reblochoni]
MSDYEIDEATADAILGHMNGDHSDDNLLIARAFGARDAVRAHMTDVTVDEGVWLAETPMEEITVRVPWSTRLTARADARREVVELYTRACRELGVTPREEH